MDFERVASLYTRAELYHFCVKNVLPPGKAKEAIESDPLIRDVYAVRDMDDLDFDNQGVLERQINFMQLALVGEIIIFRCGATPTVPIPGPSLFYLSVLVMGAFDDIATYVNEVMLDKVKNI